MVLSPDFNIESYFLGYDRNEKVNINIGDEKQLYNGVTIKYLGGRGPARAGYLAAFVFSIYVVEALLPVSMIIKILYELYKKSEEVEAPVIVISNNGKDVKIDDSDLSEAEFEERVKNFFHNLNV